MFRRRQFFVPAAKLCARPFIRIRLMSEPYIPIILGAPAPGRPDESDTREVADAISASLVRQGARIDIVEVDLDFGVLEQLARDKPHVVFNLFEATRGDAGLSYLPCAVLDHLGVPYTGAQTEAYFLTLAKTVTKRMLRASGLPTPDWWPTGEGAESAERVIVKSDREHASYGMDAGSVVPGRLARDEIAARQARFGGRFIAEAFVDGRELNVALLETGDGPQVLPVPEITFEGLPEGRPRIVDYEAKWDEASAVYKATSRRFGLEKAEPALARRVGDLARACWAAFGLAGYARVDFRVALSGEPMILEVNVNPCLAPNAGFAATAAEAGIGYDRLIALIVEAAARGAPPR
jgi:D-alanine-D-alanine ligase